MQIYDVSIITNWTWWVETILTIIGFIFVFYELKEMRKQYGEMQKQYAAMKDQQEMERKNIRISTSISLAEKYQRFIEEDQNFIVNVLSDQKEYSQLINTIEYTDLKLFDRAEFNRISSHRSGLQNYKDGIITINSTPSFINSIARAILADPKTPIKDFTIIHGLINQNWELSESEKEILKQKYQDLDENDQTFYNQTAQKAAYIDYYYTKLICDFSDHIRALLNKLEAFSMSITTNIADENIVYQSLHQTFLSVVKLLYPDICRFNSGDKADKYYTHLIEVYNRWSNRYAKELSAEINSNNRQAVEDSSKF